jgi:hypothetical protein
MPRPTAGLQHTVALRLVLRYVIDSTTCAVEQLVNV